MILTIIILLHLTIIISAWILINDSKIPSEKSHKDYRIKIETEKSGKEWFIAEIKHIIFWSKLGISEHRNHNKYDCEIIWTIRGNYIRCTNIEDANKLIQDDIDCRYRLNQKKIVKTKHQKINKINK